MRALHLCFWLHRPYELQEESGWKKGYFGGEAAFKEADKQDYQPLLALLERNVQRYSKLRISLVVSGVWLEQAERWDPELARRLKRLVSGGNVELVATPYYYAMAAFYDMDELQEQVQECQEKFEEVFGKKSQFLALPELCYNNRLARWAEKQGFKGVLTGAGEGALGWRSCNHRYEAKGCDGLSILFRNDKISGAITEARREVTIEEDAEVKIEQLDADVAEVGAQSAADFVRAMNAAPKAQVEPERTVAKVRKFSAKMLMRQLDMELLRGDLVNVYLEPGIFGKWRSMGIIGFFDELFKIWQEMPNGHLIGVEDTLKMPVAGELSIKRTVTGDGEAEQAYGLPAWWSEVEKNLSERLYAVRKPVLASKDKDLYIDFARLTAYEYAKGGEKFEAIWKDFYEKISQYIIKTENSEEKVVPKGMTESTAVRINFDTKAKEAKQRNENFYRQLKTAAGVSDETEGPFWSADDMDDMEAAIQVMAQRMKRSQEEKERDVAELAEAELIDEMDDLSEIERELTEDDLEMAEEILCAESPKKSSKAKKIFKKIVID